MENNKYFVTCGLGDFMVIYQDWCEFGGNFWATEKDGFETEEAQKYADELNSVA